MAVKAARIFQAARRQKHPLISLLPEKVIDRIGEYVISPGTTRSNALTRITTTTTMTTASEPMSDDNDRE